MLTEMAHWIKAIVTAYIGSYIFVHIQKIHLRIPSKFYHKTLRADKHLQ